MRIFPEVMYINSDPEPEGKWEDSERGGQYDDTGIIIIYVPEEDWGRLGFWLARVLLHEWLHHFADLIKFSPIHRLIHYSVLRRILS